MIFLNEMAAICGLALIQLSRVCVMKEGADMKE